MEWIKIGPGGKKPIGGRTLWLCKGKVVALGFCHNGNYYNVYGSKVDAEYYQEIIKPKPPKE